MEMNSLCQIWCIAGLTFCIIEIFTPAMFFLNIGLACFIAAIAASLGLLFWYQVIIFTVSSAIFLIWLRPIILKHKESDKPETIDMYMGKTAKVVEKVTPSGGRISIFGEEWQAKSLNNEEFEINSEVKIVKNDSIVMFVEKI